MDSVADTERNKLAVCTLFTDPSDPANLSTRLDVMDMRKCVEILAPQLDRVPPPAPPSFPDDDLTVPLTDGTLPLPIDAPLFVQRKATVVQLRNFSDRNKRRMKWEAEQLTSTA